MLACSFWMIWMDLLTAQKLYSPVHQSPGLLSTGYPEGDPYGEMPPGGGRELDRYFQ